MFCQGLSYHLQDDLATCLGDECTIAGESESESDGDSVGDTSTKTPSAASVKPVALTKAALETSIAFCLCVSCFVVDEWPKSVPIKEVGHQRNACRSNAFDLSVKLWCKPNCDDRWCILTYYKLWYVFFVHKVCICIRFHGRQRMPMNQNAGSAGVLRMTQMGNYAGKAVGKPGFITGLGTSMSSQTWKHV